MALTYHYQSSTSIKNRDVHEDGTDEAEDTDIANGNVGLPCVERWKNAGADEKKRTLDMFDEAGIFVVGCRHGIVLLICDMGFAFFARR